MSCHGSALLRDGDGLSTALWIRHHLACAYLDAGRVSEAIAIYESLLADRERILGIEHADTLFTRNNLARAYLDAGRVGGAITIYETLLADQERILGPEHPETIDTSNDLALAKQVAGHTDDTQHV
jgi:tetratricopeptide (TPR) repeat protein